MVRDYWPLFKRCAIWLKLEQHTKSKQRIPKNAGGNFIGNFLLFVAFYSVLLILIFLCFYINERFDEWNILPWINQQPQVVISTKPIFHASYVKCYLMDLRWGLIWHSGAMSCSLCLCVYVSECPGYYPISILLRSRWAQPPLGGKHARTYDYMTGIG